MMVAKKSTFSVLLLLGFAWLAVRPEPYTTTAVMKDPPVEAEVRADESVRAGQPTPAAT